MTKCVGCHHWRKFGSGLGMACHFSIDTDQLRGYPAQVCFERKIHYIPRRPNVRGRGKEVVIIPSAEKIAKLRGCSNV